MFISRNIVLLFTLLFSLICVPTYATPFFVQTIYFQPTDAPDLENVETNISKLVKESQAFYAKEMNCHGHGAKTYRIETDADDNVIVHHIEGKHKAAHYLSNTYSQIKPELPNEFNPDISPWHKQDTIRIFVIGGVEYVNGNRWGVGWPRHSNRYGGSCIIAGGNANFNASLISHELGHCFGMYHRVGCSDCLMGPGHNTLAKYEARWLSKHYHFNDTANNFTYPDTAWGDPIVEAIDEKTLELTIEVRSQNHQLHQAVLVRKSDIIVLGSDELKGKDWNGTYFDTATFQFQRAMWQNRMFLLIMDTRGNFRLENFDDVELPPEPTLIISRAGHLATIWAALKLQK